MNTWYSNQRYRAKLIILLYNQQRTHTAPHGASRIQYLVIGGRDQGSVTDFCDICFPFQGQPVQRFNIFHDDVEFQSFRVDPAMNERIEHKSIVGAW
jgi:hypothetical protein